MKINIETSELLSVLSKIKHIAKEEKNCIVLGSGCFVARDYEIEISVSSLLNRAVVKVEAEVIESGECLIEIAKLVAILETLNGNITIESKDNFVFITKGLTKCRLQSIDVEEYPLESFEIQEPSVDFSMAASALFEGLNKAKRFIESTEGSILNGVNIEIENGIARFVGTNGNKLAVVIKCVNQRDLKIQFVIPKNAIENLIVFLKPEDNVEFKVNNSTCLIEYASVKFYSRLLQGTYPKYKNIIPKDTPNNYVFSKAELKNVLERIKAVELKEDGFIVSFSIKGNSVNIEANDAKANDVLEIENYGEDLKFALNRIYLETVIGVITDENITFKMSESNRIILFQDIENKYMIAPLGKRQSDV